MNIRATSRAVVYWAFIVPTAAALFAMPTTASGTTLEDTLAAAYDKNARLDADEARHKAAALDIDRARSGYLPKISTEAQVTRSDSSRPTSSTAPTAGRVAALVSQPIFEGFRTLNQERSAGETTEASQQTLRLTTQGILLEAATAHMNVVRDQAITKLRELYVESLGRELWAARQRFESRQITVTDVAQAQSRFSSARSALELARSNERISRSTYERIVGHVPSQLVSGGMQRAMAGLTLERSLEIGLAEHPIILRSAALEKASKHQLAVVRGELLPTVALEGRIERSADDFGTRKIQETSADITGRLTFPISLPGGDLAARIEQAKYTQLQNSRLVDDARAEVRQSILAAWAVYNASLEQLKSDEEHLKSAKVALEGLRKEEMAGQRTVLDVLNGEQDLLTAQIQIETTKRNIVVSQVTVLSSIGRLQPPDRVVSTRKQDVGRQKISMGAWDRVRITYANGKTALVKVD